MSAYFQVLDKSSRWTVAILRSCECWVLRSATHDHVMSAEQIAFTGWLVFRNPALLPVLSEHLDFYEGVLPHVFLADLTRWLVSRTSDQGMIDPESNRVLSAIAQAFVMWSDEVPELIVGSFVENIPTGETGGQIRDRLGTALGEYAQQMGI